jgi:transcriptional regulator with XRE-family HTH domain
MIISQRIKELRLEKSLSQKQLALKVGCSTSMVCRWETADCEPTATAILKLSEALDCTTDYLLGKTDVF